MSAEMLSQAMLNVTQRVKWVFFRKMDETGISEIYFQQDGVTVRTTHKKIVLLRFILDWHLISRKGDIS